MVEFKLTEAEFWRLTPREYAALKRRYEAVEEHKDWRAALITSWVANSIPSKNRKRPYKPADFMPRKHVRRVATEERATANAESPGIRVYNRLSSAMKMFGGRKGRAETPEQKKYRLDVIERYRRWKTAGIEKEES